MADTAASGRFSRVLRRVLGPQTVSEAPPGMRIYAVGDIHGCLRQLEQMLKLIGQDSSGVKERCHLVFVGDYIDRGPDSKGVIDRLLSPMDGVTATYLLGNHEQALLDFLENPSAYRDWKYFGAHETLVSYGISPPRFDDDA